MLAMALAKDNSTAVPELPLQIFELGLVYKYCMMKAAEDAQTSHGKHSNLWKAFNARLIEEAALVGDESNQSLRQHMPSAAAFTSAHRLFASSGSISV
jgi:hypothetical protein